MSVLKWIWGLLRKALTPFRILVQFVLDVGSSILTWVIAGIAYVVHSILSYAGDYVENVFEGLSSVSLGFNVPPLAVWLAREVVALDVAWECFVVYVSVWIATRLGRASFAVVRLVLDVL